MQDQTIAIHVPPYVAYEILDLAGVGAISGREELDEDGKEMYERQQECLNVFQDALDRAWQIG